MKDKERENAVNEIRILASINDEFIIGYKDAFYDEVSSMLCIVMEYASGGDILRRPSLHRQGIRPYAGHQHHRPIRLAGQLASHPQLVSKLLSQPLVHLAKRNASLRDLDLNALTLGG